MLVKAITTSANGGSPQRSPNPLTATSTHCAPASRAESALAVAMPKSLWQCTCMGISNSETIRLTNPFIFVGVKHPTVSAKLNLSIPSF